MLTKTSIAPSPHAEAAKVLIDKIRALRDEIPRFTTEGLGDARSQNGTAVPEKFMESASAAVQSSTRLEQAGGADATTLRDAYAYAISYDPVVEELFALAKFMAHSIRLQRKEAGVCALDVYSLAKRLCKRKDGAELKPFVDDMRNKLGKKRQRKASSDPVPAPPPVPPAPPAKV
ncbi:MAG TPA: hypothetical protein VGQ36_08030 [Thermoanaerobaculia bacterium]|jgi:hypothetical protein|nr:hypothetical protein [Thermoanaerobaculia bacterium]